MSGAERELEIKETRQDGGYSVPYVAEVKNGWGCTFTFASSWQDAAVPFTFVGEW